MSQPLLTTASIVNICTYYIGDLASWQEFCSLAGLGGNTINAQVYFYMPFLCQDCLERMRVETLWINKFQECSWLVSQFVMRPSALCSLLGSAIGRGFVVLDLEVLSVPERILVFNVDLHFSGAYTAPLASVGASNFHIFPWCFGYHAIHK